MVVVASNLLHDFYTHVAAGLMTLMGILWTMTSEGVVGNLFRDSKGSLKRDYPPLPHLPWPLK